MDTEEQLREALLDLNRARERERSALRQSNAVLGALECISAADHPDAAVTSFLASVKQSLPADAVLLLKTASGLGIEEVSRVASTDPGIVVAGEHAPGFLQSRRRRVVDLHQVADLDVLCSTPGTSFRSLVSAPGPLDQETGVVLICLGHRPDKFGQGDLVLLERLTSIAAQALLAKRLTERNVLLAEVIDGSSTSFAIADADDPRRPLIYVNEAFEILTGYKSHEVIGQNCRFLTTEDPDSHERARLREAVLQCAPGQFELRNRREDGDAFWNRLTLYPVVAGEERHKYLVATQEDITLERQAYQERYLAESQLRSALSSTLEGVLLLSPGGEISLVNARFRDFFGTGKRLWGPGVRFDKAWAEWLTMGGTALDEARKASQQLLQRMLKGDPDREEHLPDGRIILVNSTPMPEGGCVCIAKDVTRLKITERRLSERIVAIDEAQDGMAITDTDGRFVYLNPSHVTMFGYDKQDELIGQSWDVLYNPREQAFIQSVAMPTLMTKGKWRGDVVGRARDGSPVHQDVTLTLLEDVGLICVTRDISDRIRGEAERARLREQLNTAQRQEALGQLAAGIAHDFNNVLSVIYGSARLIALEQPEMESSPHLQRIVSAGEQATELVSRMLDVGGCEPEQVWGDLRKPFQQSADLVGSGLPTAITLHVTQPDAPVCCYLDPTQVTQIILNLAINARDSMSNRPGQLTLSLSPVIPGPAEVTPIIGEVLPEQSYVRIGVKDEGSGIKEDTITNIFAPYFSTKGQDGSGLGLTVVSSILKGIGGALDVRSSPGVGTVFEAYWPVREQQPSLAKASEPSKSTELKGFRLMVVDDDPNVAQTIAVILQSEGADVTVFERPDAAIEAISDQPGKWDLVVTDYDMPGMNGAKFACQARAVEAELLIVLCTALPGWQGRSNSEARLFSGVISKPVDPMKLVATVSTCLRSDNNTPCVT